MDSAILLVVVSLGTAIITAAGGVTVALITNRKESENSAEKAMQATIDQRFILKDEQIAALEIKVKNRDEIILQLKSENDVLQKAVQYQKPSELIRKRVEGDKNGNQ